MKEAAFAGPRETGGITMGFSKGDRILFESKKQGQHVRSGVVEKVLSEAPGRYVVRWDDGRVTIFAPADGVGRKT